MEEKRTPMRRCISCMQSFPKAELLRFTVKDGVIIADGERENDGRGFYICKKQACLDKAVRKKVFNRVLRIQLDQNMVEEVIGNIADTEVIDGKEN